MQLGNDAQALFVYMDGLGRLRASLECPRYANLRSAIHDPVDPLFPSSSRRAPEVNITAKISYFLKESPSVVLASPQDLSAHVVCGAFSSPLLHRCGGFR